MWDFIIGSALFVAAFFIVTQIILPALFGGKLFWFFSKREAKPAEPLPDLEVKIRETAQEVDSVQRKVEKVQTLADEHYKQARDIKNKADNL